MDSLAFSAVFATCQKQPGQFDSCTSRAKRGQPIARRKFGELAIATTLGSVISECVNVHSAMGARPEGVNRPELLPDKFTCIIDLENFLASGEEKRLAAKIEDLEKRTGFKIRVLTQRFPQTPGLAVRDFWGVDDRTVVMVADYFGGNQLLKFNVGNSVDRLLPPRFWSLLSANLGNKFYVEKNGESAAIAAAIDNIRVCLLGNGCTSPPYIRDTI